MSNLPNIVAFCGKPGSGKSTAGELLVENLGYEQIDDGRPMREIAIKYLGLQHYQAYTQEGKLEEIEINNRLWTCREVLGEIGNAFEEKFGGDIIPLMSYCGMEPGKRYVITSCRREQGAFWASKGGMVIEIERRDCGPGYEFDSYNEKLCHTSISNNPSIITTPEQIKKDKNLLLTNLTIAMSSWSSRK